MLEDEGGDWFDFYHVDFEGDCETPQKRDPVVIVGACLERLDLGLSIRDSLAESKRVNEGTW